MVTVLFLRKTLLLQFVDSAAAATLHPGPAQKVWTFFRGESGSHLTASHQVIYLGQEGGILLECSFLLGIEVKP